jgi:predicted metal-dependent hydrolase
VTGAAGRVIQADGRSKAYRPIPRAERSAAVIAGLEAYHRDDFFLAHELLEPAWMGTDDVLERALIQGIIKLAAADVHGVRGNPAGVARNLEGALQRLRLAAASDRGLPDVGVKLDLGAVIAATERRLERATGGAATDPIVITWRTL